MNKTQIVFSLAVASIGLILGGLWGSQQDPGYEVVHVVALDQALLTSASEGPARTAAFIATMNSAASRDRAAEATGRSPSAFDGIFAARIDDSPLVQVSATSASEADVAERAEALIEATMLNLIDQDRATAGTVVARTADEIAQLEAQLEQIAIDVGVTPGTDIDARLESDSFALTSAEAQLAALPESDTYWVVRLPGDIAAYETRISELEAVRDSWVEASERLAELNEISGPSTERLARLDTAEAVVRSGTALLRGEPTQRSIRIAIGRWAGAGAALGLAGALVFIGAGTVLAKRPETAQAEGSASVPAAS